MDAIEIGVSTHTGRVRDLNEDTVVATTFNDDADNPWQVAAVLMVADGMGGHNAGEVASQLAGTMVSQIFASAQAQGLSESDVTGQNLLQRIGESIQYVNRVIHDHGAGSGQSRLGTTMTLCLVRPSEYAIGHVGDSRAYLIRKEGIEQVTHDDSWVAEEVRRGRMTETEAQNSPFRNQLLKSLGTQPDIEPSTYYGHWDSEEVLLLCSDGLTEYVTPAEIYIEVHRAVKVQQACERLSALANERGGEDNISVVAARNKNNGIAGRKPDTWPPTPMPTLVDERPEGEPQTPTPLAARPSHNPDRLLRITLLGILGSLSLVVGVLVGRNLLHWNTQDKAMVGSHTQSPEKISPSTSEIPSAQIQIRPDDSLEGVIIAGIGCNVVARAEGDYEVQPQGNRAAVVVFKHWKQTRSALKQGRSELVCQDAKGHDKGMIGASAATLNVTPYGEYHLYFRSKGAVRGIPLASFITTVAKENF